MNVFLEVCKQVLPIYNKSSNDNFSECKIPEQPNIIKTLRDDVIGSERTAIAESLQSLVSDSMGDVEKVLEVISETIAYINETTKEDDALVTQLYSEIEGLLKPAVHQPHPMLDIIRNAVQKIYNRYGYNTGFVTIKEDNEKVIKCSDLIEEVKKLYKIEIVRKQVEISTTYRAYQYEKDPSTIVEFLILYTTLGIAGEYMKSRLDVSLRHYFLDLLGHRSSITLLKE